MVIVADNMNQIYHEILVNILDNGKHVDNTLEIQNAQFTLTNLDNNVITIRENTSLEYLLGELVWYFSGDNSLDFIGKFSSFWENISDDGETANSAYGHIMYNKFGFDQVEQMIELLSSDEHSRRALININTPHNNVQDTLDEPCTIALQYFIRDGKLHSTGMMRSNDMWFGFPYDIPFFTELQKYIAHRLDIETGSYTHFVTSMHVYDRNLGNIEKSASNYANEQETVTINVLELMSNIDILHETLRTAQDAQEIIVDLCKEYNIIEMSE